MNKRGIKELAQALVDQYGLTKSQAEKFIQQMFDVLNDGLHYEKQVKIKGLGTFKVTNVAPRKSVDVNTGEPIIIEGRDKISFVPDAAMRDLVNRPFAQFETVVVNDGVDFSEIDRKYAEGEVSQAETPESDESIGMPIEPQDNQEEGNAETQPESIETSSNVHDTENDHSTEVGVHEEVPAEQVQEQQTDGNSGASEQVAAGSVAASVQLAETLASVRDSSTEAPSTSKTEEARSSDTLESESEASLVQENATPQEAGTESSQAIGNPPIEKVQNEEQPAEGQEQTSEAEALKADEKASSNTSNVPSNEVTQQTDNEQVDGEDSPSDSKGMSAVGSDKTQPQSPTSRQEDHAIPTSSIYVEPLLHSKGSEPKEDAQPQQSQPWEGNDGESETKLEVQMLREQVKHNHNMIKVLAIGLGAVIVISAFGVFYMLGQINAKENRIEHLEASSQWVKEGKTSTQLASADSQVVAIAKMDSAKTANAVSQMKAAEQTAAAEQAKLEQEAKAKQQALAQQQADAQRAKAEQAKKLAAQQNAAEQAKKQEAALKTKKAEKAAKLKAEQEKKLSSQYDKDPRVRTGAYRIVGIDHEVTVRKGQTLYSISRAALGPGMECYVEAVNGGRTEFKAGEKVKIPALKLKK
jgi:nucleoid DNA-binding protein